MPHDEMAKPVLHVVSWGAAPSALAGPAGRHARRALRRCRAAMCGDSGVLFRRSSSCQLSRAARREAVASDRRARLRWRPATGGRPHPRGPPARSPACRGPASPGRGRPSLPCTAWTIIGRSPHALSCRVTACLPPRVCLPLACDATCRRPRPAVARRPRVRSRLDLRLDGEASIPATAGTSGQYCAWL